MIKTLLIIYLLAIFTNTQAQKSEYDTTKRVFHVYTATIDGDKLVYEWLIDKKYVMRRNIGVKKYDTLAKVSHSYQFPMGEYYNKLLIISFETSTGGYAYSVMIHRGMQSVMGITRIKWNPGKNDKMEFFESLTQ